MSVRFATIGTSVITRNFAAATRLSGRATITVAPVCCTSRAAKVMV